MREARRLRQCITWLEAQVATKTKHANQGVGIHVIVQETPRVQFTLQDIQYEANFRQSDLDKLFIGPISLKRPDLRPASSHPINPLSSLASNPFKG